MTITLIIGEIIKLLGESQHVIKNNSTIYNVFKSWKQFTEQLDLKEPTGVRMNEVIKHVFAHQIVVFKYK